MAGHAADKGITGTLNSEYPPASKHVSSYKSLSVKFYISFKKIAVHILCSVWENDRKWDYNLLQ
jgi:hypothetical protein